ncbi:hypothetical protein RCIX252 [Methanocella arvoryzae MRE50]|uniref:Uncharacterized protein n=1 Tax=Methanocella arvoryzae (strain DSM 22066 / NBRC 105507 / MRE50) TaxID=351160 RepID=Q0W7C1_METAR|nr:hypothetical protein orf4 [uncultured archaeon]CAJ35722.1 hypothetical protein RCIX252 [Methanocella arvoryzae MRE50]
MPAIAYPRIRCYHPVAWAWCDCNTNAALCYSSQMPQIETDSTDYDWIAEMTTDFTDKNNPIDYLMIAMVIK